MVIGDLFILYILTLLALCLSIVLIQILQDSFLSQIHFCDSLVSGDCNYIVIIPTVIITVIFPAMCRPAATRSRHSPSASHHCGTCSHQSQPNPLRLTPWWWWCCWCWWWWWHNVFQGCPKTVQGSCGGGSTIFLKMKHCDLASQSNNDGDDEPLWPRTSIVMSHWQGCLEIILSPAVVKFAIYPLYLVGKLQCGLPFDSKLLSM